MYSLEMKKSVERIFLKLAKKNPKRMLIIEKKINEVLSNPYNSKPLRFPLQNFRRVHIDKSFVLIYRINERNNTVELWRYDHHDNIYRR
jgi:YafQ family addiction module toxin component